MWIWVNAVYFSSIIFTMGLLMPFGICYRERWMAKHTFIEGKQLEFHGRGWVLFVRNILWLVFGPLIIGIALGLFFGLFASYIGGDSTIPIIGVTLIPLVTFLVFALFTAFIARRMKKWVARHMCFVD